MPDPFLDYLREGELGRGRLTGSTLPETKPAKVTLAKPLMSPIEKPPAEEDPFLLHLRGIETPETVIPPKPLRSVTGTPPGEVLPERGWMGDIATAIPRGLIGLGEIGARTARTLSPFESPYKPEGLASEAIDATTRALESDALRPSPAAAGGSWLRTAVAGGIEAAIPSLGAGIPSALVGAKIGSVFPGIGTVAGGLVGFILGAGTAFGLSEYDKFMEEAKGAGIEEDKARPIAVTSGLVEAGGEAAANLIGAKLLGFTGKALSQPIKNSIRQMLRVPLKETLRGTMKQIPVEISTEMFQGATEQFLRQKAGIQVDQTPWEVAKDAIGPTMVMTILFGMGSRAFKGIERKQIEIGLENPSVPIEARRGAVQRVSEGLKKEAVRMKKTDPESAQDLAAMAMQWDLAANDAVIRGQPITLDQNIKEFLAGEERGLRERVPVVIGPEREILEPISWPEEEPQKLLTTRVPPGMAFGEDFIMANEPWVVKRGTETLELPGRDAMKLLPGPEKPIPQLPFIPPPAGTTLGEGFQMREPVQPKVYAKVSVDSYKEVVGMGADGRPILGDKTYKRSQIVPKKATVTTGKGIISPEAGVTSAGILPTGPPSTPASGELIRKTLRSGNVEGLKARVIYRPVGDTQGLIEINGQKFVIDSTDRLKMAGINTSYMGRKSTFPGKTQKEVNTFLSQFPKLGKEDFAKPRVTPEKGVTLPPQPIAEGLPGIEKPIPLTLPLPEVQMDAIRTQGRETGGLGIAMVQRIISNMGEKISVKQAKGVIDHLLTTGEIEPKIGGGPATFPYIFTDKVPAPVREGITLPEPKGVVPEGGVGFESAKQKGIRELNEIIDKSFPDRADVSEEPWVLRQMAEMWGEVHEGMAGKRIGIEDKTVGQGTNLVWMGEPSTFPEWFKNQGWGKEKVLMAIKKKFKGQKLGVLEKRITDAVSEEAKKRYKEYKVEEADFLAKEEEIKRKLEEAPEFLKDETADGLTKGFDNEIMGLKEEWREKGYTESEINSAIQEAYDIAKAKGIRAEVEGIKELPPEPTKELGKPSPEFSPIEKDQFKLPGMKIGVGERPSGEAPTLEGSPLGEAAIKAEQDRVQPKLFGEKIEPEPTRIEPAKNRFVVTNEGMKKGFWKVVDTETGNTERTVQTKSVAESIAAGLNKSGPEGISGASRKEPAAELAPKFDHDQTMALINSDRFLKQEFDRLPGTPEKKAELIFNTYVLGDSVMEAKYGEGGKPAPEPKPPNIYEDIRQATVSKPVKHLTSFEVEIADTGAPVTVPKGKRFALENILFEEAGNPTGELGGKVEQTGTGKIGTSVFEIKRPYGKLIYNEGTGQFSASREDLTSNMATASSRDVDFGVDKTLLLQTISKDIVNNDLPGTIANESLQNALDALPKIGAGDRKIKVEVNTNYSEIDGIRETYVTISDTGSGMSAKEVENNLLRLGAKGKEGTEARGGYGLAKAGFLLTPRRAVVTTIKDGVKTVLSGTKEQFFGVRGAGKATLSTSDALPSEKSGTKFELSFFNRPTDAKEANAFELSSWDASEAFEKYIKTGIMIPGIEFEFTSEGRNWTLTSNAASELPQTFKAMSIKVAGSKIKVYFVPDPKPITHPDWTKKYNLHTDVYNKGLGLFSLHNRLRLEGLNSPVDWKVVVDFEKTPDVRDREYPFIRNRTEMNEEVSKEISAIVNEKIKVINEKQFNESKADFEDMVKRSPVVNGVKILIPFKETAEFDKTSSLIESHPEMINELSGLFRNFRGILEKAGEKDIDLSITVDPKVHGYRSNPSVVGHEIYAINPFAITDRFEVSQLFRELTGKGSDPNTMFASNMVHTMAHEYAHNFESTHGEAFALRLADVYVKLSHGQLSRLEQEARRFYENHGKLLKSLQQDFSGMGKGGSRLSADSLTVRPPGEIEGGERGEPSIQATRQGPEGEGGIASQLATRTKKYYTTSGGMDWKEMVETEVEDRGNYPLEEVNRWKKKYGITDEDRLIWVSPSKEVAHSYTLSAEERERGLKVPESEMGDIEVKEKGFIIPESNDGDNGYLYVMREGKPDIEGRKSPEYGLIDAVKAGDQEPIVGLAEYRTINGIDVNSIPKELLGGVDPKDVKVGKIIDGEFVETKDLPKEMLGEKGFTGTRTPEDIGVFVNDLRTKFRDIPDIEIVPTFQDLPNRSGVNPNAAGVFDPVTGKVYFVSDRIKNAAHAREVFFHDVMGHWGLPRMMGKDYNGLVENIIRDFRPDIERIAKKYGFDTSDPRQLWRAAEEKIGEVAQKGDNPNLLRRIIHAVKEWIAEKFGVDFKVSDNDIRNLIRKTSEAMRKGEISGASDPANFKIETLRRQVGHQLGGIPKPKAGEMGGHWQDAPYFMLADNPMNEGRGLWESIKSFPNKYTLGIKGSDLKWSERLYMLPWHIGQKFANFRKLIDVQLNRDESREQMNHEMVQKAFADSKSEGHEFLALPKDQSQSLFKLMVWSDDTNTFFGKVGKGGEISRDVSGLQSKAKELLGKELNPDQVTAYYAWKRTMDSAWEKVKKQHETMTFAPYEDQPWYSDLKNAYTEFSKLKQKGLTFKNYILEKMSAGLFQPGGKYTDAQLKDLGYAADRLEKPISRLKELRDDMGRWAYYVPRVREKGDYVIRGFDPENKIVVSVRAVDQIRGGMARDRFMKEYPGLRWEANFEPQSIEEMYQKVSDIHLEQFIKKGIDRAKRKEKITPEEADHITDSLFEAVADDLKARGFASHFIMREEGAAVKGYEAENGQKVFYDYMTGLSGFLTKQRAAFDFFKSLEGIDPSKQPELFKEGSSYVEDMLRNSDRIDKLSGKVRAAAFTYYLAGSVKAAMVQFTQNFVTGVPHLGRMTKNPLKKYVQSMKDIAAWKMKPEHLSKEEQTFLHEMHEKGIDTAQYLREVRGRMKNQFGGTLDQIGQVLATPFSGMEVFNRESASLAMFRVMRNEKGKTYREAFDAARDYVYNTHYLYGKSNLPSWARAGTPGSRLARTAYTFRSFNHNFLLSLMQSLKGPDGKIALDTMGRTMAYLAIFGGATAIPFFDDLLDGMERMTGTPYKSNMRKALKGIGGDFLAKFGMEGLPAILGADLTGSLKIGIPTVSSSDVYGVYGGMWDKGKKALDSFQKADIYRGVESLMPSFLEAPMKGYRMATEGATTPTGKVMFDEEGKPVTLTPGETAAQVLGFRPERISILGKERRSFENVKKHYDDQRDDLYAKLRMAKGTERADVLKQIRDYNLEVQKYRGVVGSVTQEMIRNALKQRPDKKFIRFESR